MDGRGRALDNILVERLWRTVKYEEVYLKDYATVKDVADSLRAFFLSYNQKRVLSEAGSNSLLRETGSDLDWATVKTIGIQNAVECKLKAIGMWKLTLLRESAKNADSLSSLEKPWLSHSSHRP